jgi:hypothetical protein
MEAKAEKGCVLFKSVVLSAEGRMVRRLGIGPVKRGLLIWTQTTLPGPLKFRVQIIRVVLNLSTLLTKPKFPLVPGA